MILQQNEGFFSELVRGGSYRIASHLTWVRGLKSCYCSPLILLRLTHLT